MNPEQSQRAREIIADVLAIPVEQVGEHLSPETVAAWDSLRHLNLVLALEQECGLQFSPAEIEQMTSVLQIMRILDRKLGDPRDGHP